MRTDAAGLYSLLLVGWGGVLDFLKLMQLSASGWGYGINQEAMYNFLGLMMVSLGVGGVAAGIAHLLAHGFFKALLFLGAGSVIHGAQHEQDIRKMGGLRGMMPLYSLPKAPNPLAGSMRAAK